MVALQLFQTQLQCAMASPALQPAAGSQVEQQLLSSLVLPPEPSAGSLEAALDSFLCGHTR